MALVGLVLLAEQCWYSVQPSGERAVYEFKLDGGKTQTVLGPKPEEPDRRSAGSSRFGSYLFIAIAGLVVFALGHMLVCTSERREAEERRLARRESHKHRPSGQRGQGTPQ
jgi:hypothetical protein